MQDKPKAAEERKRKAAEEAARKAAAEEAERLRIEEEERLAREAAVTFTAWRAPSFCLCRRRPKSGEESKKRQRYYESLRSGSNCEPATLQRLPNGL